MWAVDDRGGDENGLARFAEAAQPSEPVEVKRTVVVDIDTPRRKKQAG